MLTETRPAAAPVARTTPLVERGGPQRWGRPRNGQEGSTEGYTWATLALLALTLLSAGGLLRVFIGRAWLLPLVATVVGVYAVCWAARRAHLPRLAAIALDLMAVWALAAWTVLPSSTAYGFPGHHTASQFWSQLVQAHTDFATAVTPVAADSTGFKLIAVIAVGLVAVMADWAAFRWRSALYGAAPPFAYFVGCCAFGQGRGRGWTVTAVVAGLLLFLLVHRVTVGQAGQAWFGNQRAGNAGWAITAGCLTAAASLTAAIVVIPALGGTDGSGIFGWRGGLGGPGPGPRQVANPVVDLHTRLITESKTPVFTVQSSVPSYWRLTSLDTFTGQDWVSTDSYKGFGPRLPGAQAVPPGTRLVQERFHIQQLDSVWLPDAFTPVSVVGVRHVGYDPISSSLITAQATSDGLNYTVESYQYLSTLSSALLEDTPAVHITPSLDRFVQLPTGIPPSVVNLAQEITGGQTSEFGKALALQNYFLNPRHGYEYTLNPADDGYGLSSLVNFLFSTKQGFCQQFAGAFAVLAREIGLPTRLAVGFATGTKVRGVYQVTDADAHAWPEVYFGPTVGWVPFEPTPGDGFSNPEAQGYAPTSGGTQAVAPESPGARVGPRPTANSGSAASGGAGAVVPPAVGNGLPITTPATTRHVNTAWSVVLFLALALLLWSGIVVGMRRGRWWLRRWRCRGDPAALVLACWAEVTEALNWWGARRRVGETDEEFATRAARLVTGRLKEPSARLPGGYGHIARLATEATFAAEVPSRRPKEANSIAHDIRRNLFQSASFAQRLAWMTIPRPGRRTASGRSLFKAPSGMGGRQREWRGSARAVAPGET